MLELVRSKPHEVRWAGIDAWRAGMHSAAPGLEINSPMVNLEGEVSHFDFAGARLWWIKSDTQCMVRTRASSDSRCRPMAVIQVEGRTRVRQFDRECVLTEGTFTFIDAAAAHRVEHEGPFLQLVVQFPRSSFIPAMFQRAVAVLADSNQLDQPFFRCVDSIWDAAASLHPMQHISVVRAVVALAQLTSPMSKAASEDEIPCRVLRAIEYIEDHLGEPWLCAEAVAQAQGVSRRYLDALFKSKNHCLQSWIWERRLQRAAEELALAEASDKRFSKSILQIAIDMGFKTPSHFSRAFSNRFGMPPSEFKRIAQRDGVVDTSSLVRINRG
jgi:AraC-like DNA-binding protein